MQVTTIAKCLGFVCNKKDNYYEILLRHDFDPFKVCKEFEKLLDEDSAEIGETYLGDPFIELSSTSIIFKCLPPPPPQPPREPRKPKVEKPKTIFDTRLEHELTNFRIVTTISGVASPKKYDTRTMRIHLTKLKNFKHSVRRNVTESELEIARIEIVMETVYDDMKFHSIITLDTSVKVKYLVPRSHIDSLQQILDKMIRLKYS